MYSLKDMNQNREQMPKLLIENGNRHINYKTYTSMEVALGFLLDGYLFLSDGSVWNDKTDQDQMKKQKAYGKSFSFSTRENVAMWMLYGDKRGKNGAILNFTQSVIKEIEDATQIDVVQIRPRRSVDVIFVMEKAKKDYEIFMTDVLYTDEISNTQSDKEEVQEEESKKVNITYNEQHLETSKDFYDNDYIFTKRYEWCYEKECRLVVKPSPEMWERIKMARTKLDEYKKERQENNNGYIALRIFVPSYRKMKDRLIRSPIYEGKVIFGEPSSMTGEVEWSL